MIYETEGEMLFLIFLQTRVVIQGFLLKFVEFIPVGINRLLVICLVSQRDIVRIHLLGFIKCSTVSPGVVDVWSRTVFFSILLGFTSRFVLQTFCTRNEQRSKNTDVNQLFLLAVDRYGFSKLVTEKIRSHPNITVVPGEVTAIPEGNVIIASGPLTSDALAAAIAEKIGDGHTLNFFDAAAPLVTFESVDMDSAFFASRYDKGTADYINCPMTEEEYDAFWQALTTAEEASVHGFEDKNVFEGCMPVEVMARRGHDTLCYGPLKPRGLRDPKTGKEPYAVVQLRRDNAQGSVYNLVGFQTHLRFPEQKRVFSMIPALHDAEFVRYGVMHRNTYLRSPGMLDRYYRLIADDRIAFAGQMTGVEGYIESAASGFLAGIEMARRLEGKPPVDFPRETAIGALGLYISDTTVSDFQPMNVNFGIMPPLGYRIKGGKRVKNAQLAARSLEKIDAMREDVLSDRKGE